MSSRPREPRHLDWVDAVRGLAFLLVLVVHAASCVGPFPEASLFKTGYYGVQLFFLASAITLCNSMAIRQDATRGPSSSFIFAASSALHRSFGRR